MYTWIKQSKHRLICLLAMGVLVLANFGYMLVMDKTRNSIVSFHNIENPLVLKTDSDTNQTTVYQKTYFLFAGNPQVLNEPVDDYEIKWLSAEVAAFIYQSNGKQHVYVMATGDHGRGSYYHAAAELQGTWKNNQQTITIKPLRLKLNEVTYDLNNAIEVGTSAVILNNSQGDAEMIIGYGDNLSFTKQGNIKKGSTIVLLDLSNPKFLMTTYSKTSTDFSESSYQVLSPEEEGKELVKKMKDLIKQDPALTSFENEYYFVKVLNTTNDPKDIAMAALQAFEGQGGQGSNCSSDVSLKSVTVTAGTEQDFFMKAFTTETTSCSNESETMDITWSYRVMKADNGYLIAKTLANQNGDTGLKQIKKPETLPCIGEPFHYFIQK